MKKINTYIITGFLGSGKTTVLNNLLKQVADNKNIIVENEFGKVNIDKQLVDQKYDELYELTNGCICCTHDEGFFELLNELYQKRTEIDNLFIETTGIADVSPIIATFQRQDVKQTFSLINTICIIDAEVIENYLQEFCETERQIVASDILIINKVNRVKEDYLRSLRQLLIEKNPLATIVTTADGYVSIHDIQIQNNNDFTNKIISTSKDFKHSALKTQLYETTTPFDLIKFQYTMTFTMLMYNHQIYRCKGFIRTADDKVYLFQSAGKGISLTEMENKKINKSQIVFIGKNVEFKSIERIMNQTLQHANAIENENS